MSVLLKELEVVVNPVIESVNKLPYYYTDYKYKINSFKTATKSITNLHKGIHDCRRGKSDYIYDVPYGQKYVKNDHLENHFYQAIDNCFIKQKDEIAELTKKIDDISKQFADYRKSSTEQITELQTLNKSYQTKLDEAITVINQQIKTHETNIAELVDKIKIEQEAIKKQIEEHLKLNEVVTNTNENYADLAKQFANMVEFLRYVLGEVNVQLPELKIDLGQLALSQ